MFQTQSRRMELNKHRTIIFKENPYEELKNNINKKKQLNNQINELNENIEFITKMVNIYLFF